MNNQDIYSTIGAAIELNAVSKYHRQFSLYACVNLIILPAIKNKQIKLYYSDEQRPMALIIWAWFSNSVMESMCSPEGKVIEPHEWNCGSKLFISDFIAPYGNTKKIFKDVFTRVFPDENKAVSIRRNLDGSFRKKNTWIRK